MKKRSRPAKTKEQQADEDGWVYVYASTIIRGWDRVWIEGARAQAPEVEGRAQRPSLGVERTMHLQRERASVRTLTRPVISTGMSIILYLG